MADFPTFAELFRIARDEALSKNSSLTREIIEREGTDANALTAGGVAAADEVVGQLTKVASSLYLDSAVGQDLDRLVFDRYNLVRKPASPAVGTVEFSTTAANPTAFSIPVNTKLQTSDGKQFLTTAAATFPTNSTGPVLVAVRSAKAGLSQQAKAGTITNILASINGAPADLKVTNTLATAGADNEELDDSLRDRAKRFFTTVRRGTLKAIEAGALAVPGVRKATAFEATDGLGRPAKSVQLLVSDAFTDQLVNSATVPAAYEAQSQVLANAVFQSLDDVRAAGIFVDVRVAQVVLLTVQLGLSFVAGVDVDSVAFQARAIIVAYVNSLPPGEDFRRSDAIAALRGVAGLIVSDSDIISPAGDVVTTQLQVLRTTLGTVVASTVQPDRALAGSTNPDAV